LNSGNVKLIVVAMAGDETRSIASRAPITTRPDFPNRAIATPFSNEAVSVAGQGCKRGAAMETTVEYRIRYHPGPGREEVYPHGPREMWKSIS
jgi:hypothetical protein